MFVSFSILLRTKLSDIQDVPALRIHSRLSHTCHPHSAPQGTFLALQTRAADLKHLSPREVTEGSDGGGRRIPLGNFTEQRGELAGRMSGRPSQVAPDLPSVSRHNDL